MYEKPAVEALYNKYKGSNVNKLNVVVEYVNTPDV